MTPVSSRNGRRSMIRVDICRAEGARAEGDRLLEEGI
jgi:hypothetical protein